MMYFLTKIILVLYVIFYSMDQGCNGASSIKCYDCDSLAIKGEDCYDNPKQKKFETTCNTTLEIPDVLNQRFDAANADIWSIVKHAKSTQSGISTRAVFKVDECWTFLSTKETTKKQEIVRMCGSTEWSTEKFKEFVAKAGQIIDSIDRCDTDLCNSSDVLSVGSFCSVSSLLFAYFINFKSAL